MTGSIQSKGPKIYPEFNILLQCHQALTPADKRGISLYSKDFSILVLCRQYFFQGRLPLQQQGSRFTAYLRYTFDVVTAVSR